MTKARAEKSIWETALSCRRKNILKLLSGSEGSPSVIPCDTKDEEKRVALTPEAVNLLVETDNEVILQKGAGNGANYTDKDYSENGAIITDSPARVFSSDVIIKVAPFTEKEADYLKGNQVLISYLNVLKLSEDTLAKLIRKKVTAIAFEKIRDANGVMPVIESMSEISGVTSILHCFRLSEQSPWRQRSDAWRYHRCNSDRSYNPGSQYSRRICSQGSTGTRITGEDF